MRRGETLLERGNELGLRLSTDSRVVLRYFGKECEKGLLSNQWHSAWFSVTKVSRIKSEIAIQGRDDESKTLSS